MNSYAPKDSIQIDIPVMLNNIAVDISAYSVNDAIDGTKGTPPFKIQVSIGIVSGATLTPSTTVDGIVCDKLTAFRSSNSELTNMAVLNLRKGFLVTTDTQYTAVAWYDSTGGVSDGWRKCGEVSFVVKPTKSDGISPPYNT